MTIRHLLTELEKRIGDYENQLTPVSRKLIRNWPEKIKSYQADEYVFHVRNQEIRQRLYTTSLSGTRIPKVLLPKYSDWGDILRWQAQENVPGSFPFTAGSFPLKREGEDPTRMFAGEGSPERTNKRFHYLSASQPATGSVPHLILLHYMVKIRIPVRIFMEKSATAA